MANLRWRLIALLLWVLFLSNVERFVDIVGADVEVALFIVICMLLAAILPITPLVRQNSLLPLSIALSILYVFLIGLTSASVFTSAGGTYMVILGYTGMLITLGLSYQVGMAYWEFHNAVSDITFASTGNHMNDINEMRETIDVEMIRSRRTERPLSLMIFEADPTMIDMRTHKLVQSVQRSMIQRYVLATIAQVLSRTLRRTDVVFGGEHPNRLIVLAPDTNEQEADRMVHRISTIVRNRLGIDGYYSVATFPDQALTFEDLLNVAEQDLTLEMTQSMNEKEDQAREVIGQRPSEVTSE
ncbi:MAG: diguanylate cyclase [Chloroflexales bacterium]